MSLSDLSSSVQPSLRNLGVVFDSAMSLVHHSKQLIRNSSWIKIKIVELIWNDYTFFYFFLFRLLQQSFYLFEFESLRLPPGRLELCFKAFNSHK